MTWTNKYHETNFYELLFKLFLLLQAMFFTDEVNQLKAKTVVLNTEKRKLVEANKIAKKETKELQIKLSGVVMVLEDKKVRN